ncbi:MAG: M20/M25/M40 family metallo-hydrolase [Cyclobacteriaceae bacterium]|nr:M20/M25/M40 family metallo-hydrolase [Cyclobacteriaceae bacterium]
MKNTIAFLLISFSLSFALAQDVDLNAVHRIKEEGLNNSKVEDIAFHLTDASGPRLTNSAGYKRAADWAVKQLTDWGLKNAAQEKWGDFGKGWQIDKSYVAMTAPYYFSISGTPKAWTGGTNGPVSGDVTLLVIDKEEDFKKFEGKIGGKIVLVKSGASTNPTFEADASRMTDEELTELAKQPIGSSSRYKPEMIAQYLARRAFSRKVDEFLKNEKALLVIRGRNGKHGTYFTSNGASYSVDAPQAVAEVETAPEHADLMARLIEKGIPVKVEADIKTTFTADPASYNVIGEIPGTDKDLKAELVMLGGHLDSWHAGTGATDNAAGCIVMMEAVRILQATGLKPRRTIRIALWSGEEQGLHGSRNYVKNHFADPADMKLKTDHSKVSGYFNIDNGTGRIRGIYLQGNDAVRPIFEKWFTPFSDMIDNTTVTIQNTGGTDHLAFDAVGIPGFQFIQDPIEYNTRTHHTNADTYERLMIDDLKQMAVIVATFVYNTAQRQEKLPRKPLPSAQGPSQF